MKISRGGLKRPNLSRGTEFLGAKNRVSESIFWIGDWSANHEYMRIGQRYSVASQSAESYDDTYIHTYIELFFLVRDIGKIAVVLERRIFILGYLRRGTGRPNLSRETKFSGANGDSEKPVLILPVQLTTSSKIGNPNTFDPYSCYKL